MRACLRAGPREGQTEKKQDRGEGWEFHFTGAEGLIEEHDEGGKAGWITPNTLNGRTAWTWTTRSRKMAGDWYRQRVCFEISSGL